MRILRAIRSYALLGGALALAAGAGMLTASALGISSQAAETITINVGERGPIGPPGPPGPQGEQGPAGPAGGQTCPAGFHLGDLVINHPGGQVTLHTCLK